MKCLQALKCYNDPASGAANPRIGAARLDAVYAAGTLMDDFVKRECRALLLTLEIEDRGRGNMPEQQTRRVVFRITADLTDTPPHLGKCRRYIRGCRGFTDAALAIERNFFHKLTYSYSYTALRPFLQIPLNGEIEAAQLVQRFL